MRVSLIRYHNTGDVNTRLPKSLNRIRGVLPPLGMAYLAACLEGSGHTVEIWDAQISGYLKEDIRRKILEFEPDVVGITTMTSNFKGALEAAKIAKDCGTITVIGGPNLEVFPDETLSYDCIDYGILGEAEISFVQLIEALEKKSEIKHIEGLAYKESGKVKINSPQIIEDIDRLPFPARHLLPIGNYTSIISRDPMTTMITSRGCPYQCSFCFKQSSDKKIRYRNPVNVVDEMELLVKKYNIKEIMFYDDTIVTNLSHIEGICREILKRNLKVRWESPSRVDKVHLPLLKLMRSAGCIRLRYGVESGDKDILKAMNKKITPDMILRAFHLTHLAGIEAFAYLMVGYLNETRQTFENTMNLARIIKPDQIMITLATPYPKTRLETESVKAGKLSSEYWRNFILGREDTAIPPLVNEAADWVKEAYSNFYLNPRYILKRLKYINSYSQLKKHLLAGLGIFLFKVR